MAEIQIESLIEWLDVSPTPFHVVDTAAQLLESASFIRHFSLGSEVAPRGFYIRDGALIAWQQGTSKGSLRIIGAHTDSPNLRVQPRPDVTTNGWAQLGVEIYGGVLLNSWLDRDLALAGRVVDRDGNSHLFNVNEPLARIPQLAIHLDREIGEKGLLLDRHQHVNPVWGTSAPTFSEWLSDVTSVRDVLAYDAHLYDISPAAVLGVDESLLASGRLDNQVSCWAGISALVDGVDTENTVIVVLNDHEEVGSESTTGAASTLLRAVVDMLSHDLGIDNRAQYDYFAKSWCLSADNAHAVHPNYQERHESRHAPLPNRGPALKLNGNQRYATSARGAAFLRNIAHRSEIPLQTFVSKNNMPCGSTIGPITATALGIDAIDIGIPQLSMHSARELCGVEDPIYLVALMQQFAIV